MFERNKIVPAIALAHRWATGRSIDEIEARQARLLRMAPGLGQHEKGHRANVIAQALRIGLDDTGK